MATLHHLPPSAATLTASLRDLGYALETAIADLIDNSITADATDVRIFCNLSCTPAVLVVADNGRGMTKAEVISAMRHGSTDPRQDRGPKDLGRFGLGLKTASFSQCRRLTVISSQSGEYAGAEWDLAQVEAEDDWFINILDCKEISEQPYLTELKNTGTLVIWRDLDRLFEDETGERRDEIVNEKLAVVERHLSLVFHRFLAGEVKGRRRLAIRINGHPVTPFDPFCRKNEATQVLREEKVWIGNEVIAIQPFILPHHSRLTASEHKYYQDRSDFVSNQGAYIYRNGRLMAWGDWFRLIPKGETTKLARVQIDFTNSLDEAWTIDIKKSRARPPPVVRHRLRQIIDQITARSVSIHRGRGQKLFQEDPAPFWERYADQLGIRFALNAEHPLVAALRSRLTPNDAHSLDLLIQSVAASLPVEMIYSDYSTNPSIVRQTEVDALEALRRLKGLKKALYGDGLGDANAFLQIVRSTRLFEGHVEIVENFISESFI
ncbi:ATP-binding protein [Methylorubrum salsuginis]|uniref:Histidine kinase-, DNA gyrase B-, and HSP90-like ATPase n=1 Tax=Methylorubrum salsuginis TaxID=414703 RepID=A0A1I4LIU3_9HYPH|nr:ATP-binding protein [Methylorubrum salsuginis]SFL91028.1 Histidine kinase-, DNA gyrase B-, and HSP90-like ATPase [Methylorubrum salsuginis]